MVISLHGSQKSLLRGRGSRERERSDVSILVHTTADETCALSKDIS